MDDFLAKILVAALGYDFCVGFMCTLTVFIRSAGSKTIREPSFTFVCSSELPLCSRDEPVFVAWCTPLAMPENREIVVQGATNVFTTVHSLDMKIIEVDDK